MENIPKRLGQFVKDWRKERGVSQAEFAKSANITQSQLSRIETGHFNPKSNTIVSLCTATRTPVTAVYLFMMEETDVIEEKRDAFRRLKPVMDNMIKEFY